jgi:murein DD-endopeptidase MepM/ murein hydrolase activator NlpD
MIRRLFVLALVVSLAMALAAPGWAASSADDLAGVKARIASLERQIQASSGQRSAIASEVLAASGRLESAESDVETAEGNVATVRDDLARKREVLTGVRTELAERLLILASTRLDRDAARVEAEASVVQAYMRGGVDDPSLAFSAAGIAEISVGLGYLDTLTGNSADAADRYGEVLALEQRERARIQQLEGAMVVDVKGLEDAEHEAEVLASELAIKRAALENEYQAQRNLLARVEAEIADYEHDKEGFEAEEASIRATIAAAAAAAAAEAKAQAEAKTRAEAAARAAAATAAAAPTATSATTTAPRTVTTSPPAVSTGNGTLSWPIRGSIDSPFGWRIHPISRDRRYHTGIDIDGPFGMPIKAAKAGIVILAGVKGGYGNSVMIDHQNGWVTLYAHQQSLNVQVGQYVTTSTTIGWVGSSGNSTGPHLHFELRVNGVPVDPMRYL